MTAKIISGKKIAEEMRAEMKTEIDEPFGNVNRSYAFLLHLFCGEDKFVHARSRIGQLVVGFEFLHHIVRVQHSVIGDSLKSLTTQKEDVDECL